MYGEGLGDMSKMSKWNDIFFGIIVIGHLLTREWPMGGTLQTIVDVMLGLSAMLILLKYYLEYKKTGNFLGFTVAGVERNEIKKTPIMRKKKRRK